MGRHTELWGSLGRQWHAFTTPGPESDPERSSAALREMGRIIREGAETHHAQGEVLELIERTRKVAESERRRVADERQSISAARALAFAGSVFALMREALGRHIGGTEEEGLIIDDIRVGLAERIRADVDGRGRHDGDG